jgi:hypothetical protein
LTLQTDHKQVLPDEHPFMGGCPIIDGKQQDANCQNSKRGVGQFTRHNIFVTQRKVRTFRTVWHEARTAISF